MKKQLKLWIKKALFGVFFAVISIFGLISAIGLETPSTYALPAEDDSTVVEVDADEEQAEVDEAEEEASETKNKESGDKSCKKSLGAIGWLVCPTTGKIAEAVDWLYEKIESVLLINPIPAEDGSPIYEIWKYLKGITNIVFIIFLLIVIYSQITGLGINNYGIKKVLPKLIITAVLVNLSFLICQIVVDVSNIVGNGLRDVFTSISEAAVTTDGVKISHALYAEMFEAIGGGTALSIGTGLVAFELGAIWMLIPLVLGALIAVVSGLITIALRQAVVALLIMISPLAMVAYMLPNTEKWFTKWKDLLFKMLVFYPMFSLLFGASQLAGFAIIASAKDGFGVLLGAAVEIFPLFFAWSLMKMSGTFLSTINAKLNSFAAGPLATNRAWADSHRQLSKQRHLASKNAITPSLKLMQLINDRKVAREKELDEKQTLVKERGLAYRARQKYVNGDLDGVLSRNGEDAYENQARVMRYQRISLRDKNNFNKGFSYRAEEGTSTHARLEALDMANVNASDMLKVEQSRGEKIDYENAVGFHDRMEAAINAHMDLTNGFRIDEDSGQRVRRKDYKFHFDPNNLEQSAEMARYNAMKQIMEGNLHDAQFAAASAAQAYDTQKKVIETKWLKYLELTPPTKDVVYRMNELTKSEDAILNIDSIIAGMRILNQRGDTDLVREQMNNVLKHGLDVGTHASQSLASFLMFEVKDNDPWLRRFGKYINLETANAYNKNKRKETKITYDEYIKGYHEEPDGTIMYAKRPMSVLMEGTSLDGVERTAYANFDESLVEAYSYIGEDGKKHLNTKEYLKKRKEIEKAVGPQFISASLKYLSGSEQLKSAVSFLTGYSYSQMTDENGKVMLDDKDNVMYEWKARWDKGGDLSDNPEMAREYFRRNSLQYFKDQTPNQILALRTDYRDPLMGHLADEFLNDPEEGEEYQRKLSEIQGKYGDLPIKEADKKRKSEIKALKMEMAGKQVRKILGESGKLEQIYRTRRSGAANGAKDWLRSWVGLDDEVMMGREVKYYDKKRRRQKLEENGYDVDEEEYRRDRVYGGDKQKEFIDDLDAVWRDNMDLSVEEFYELGLKKIREWFGDNTSILELEYKRAYKDGLRTGGAFDAYALKNILEDLLQDLNNYPDA